MGQKRTQNMIDKKVGAHLAKLETDILAKIDRQLTDRLDALIVAEKALKSTLNRSEEITEINRQFVEKYEMKMTLNYLLVGVLGGGIGGLVTFLLIWFFG